MISESRYSVCCSGLSFALPLFPPGPVFGILFPLWNFQQYICHFNMTVNIIEIQIYHLSRMSN